MRAAIEQASRRGIIVLTLVSDLQQSARRDFIGIDNVAAGRTAASLLGRFCAVGRIGVVAGSLGLVDHQQRLEGFRQVLAEEFPRLEIIGPVEGYDNDARTEAAVADLLKHHGPVAGLYNLGAGNAGLIAALDGTGRAGKVRVIAHELTDASRDALERGTIDVVLDQNPDLKWTLARRRWVDSRIQELQQILANAEVLVGSNLPPDQVRFNTLVKVLNLQTGKECQFKMVGPLEADARNGCLSTASPLGRALMGRARGDRVEVDTPAGRRSYLILEIEMDAV